MPEEFDVVVVGAGQAGLALGYYLKQQGARFLIIDAASEVGESWQRRWDSLTLFTPAQFDQLPGLPLQRAAGTFPGKDEVARYLARYAEVFELPLRLNTEALALSVRAGGYRIEAHAGEVEAHQVVVATGAFQRPYVPSFSRDLDPNVNQLHSSSYENPGALEPGGVLVVGAGNSGWQIAEETAESRKTYLSGRSLPRVPSKLFGKRLFWWLMTGLMAVPANTALGRRMSSNDNVVMGDLPLSLQQSGRLTVVPHAVSAQGDRVEFEDGSSIAVDNVVWATGYRNDYGWIDLPIFDEAGRPIQLRGVTAAAGLYFLGLRWQHSTGSALLGWVKHDARFIARQIERFQREE